MSAALRPPPARMTVAEFVDWTSGWDDGAHWQLVDGEPLAMAPASLVHGMIQSELGRLIGNHLRTRSDGCVVVTAPGVIPNIRARENFRIPDLGVTCSAVKSGLMMPDPVLLIEIISPGNEAETRASVWTYASIPSVTEILLLHSTRVEAELLHRAGGNWPVEPQMIGPEGTLVLDSIGLSMPLAAAYRTSGLT